MKKTIMLWMLAFFWLAPNFMYAQKVPKFLAGVGYSSLTLKLDADFNGFQLPTQRVPINLIGVAAYFPNIGDTPISFGLEVGYDPKIEHQLDLGFFRKDLELKAVGVNAVINARIWNPTIVGNLKLKNSGLLAATLVSAGEKLAINSLEENYVLQTNLGLFMALDWNGISVGHKFSYSNIRSTVLDQQNPQEWGWSSKLSAAVPILRTGLIVQGNYTLINESVEGLWSIRLMYGF